MLAYDFLKENPQLRDAQLKYNWSELFLNSDTPYSVKQELKELQMITLDIDDAILYWHQQYIYQCLFSNNSVMFHNDIWKSFWLKQLYSIVQHNNFNSDIIKACFNFIIHIDVDYNDVEFSLEQTAGILTKGYLNKARPDFLSKNIICYLCGIDRTNLTEYQCRTLITTCTLNLITKLCNPSCADHQGYNATLIDVYQLIEDTGLQTASDFKKFHSLNAIQKMHDDRTDREVAKLMENVGDMHYMYHPNYETLVKQAGFILPKGPASLIERGKQHRNCVGTYNDKCTQEAMNNCTVMRLLFSRTATIELRLECMHDIIVSTKIEQSKGVGNKNIEVTPEFTNLRVALTGQPISILNLKVVKL